MTRGARSPAAYFNGAETGPVGHAQAGGDSGTAGQDVTQINSASGAGSDKQPSGTPAGGTENLQADAKSLSASHSGPSEPHTEYRPADVKVSDGLSVPERIKR